MLNWARGRALATAGACLAIAGCTALAGIQDGQLVVVDSGAGDGSLSDGPGSDGPVADGGMDGTTDGGGSDSSPLDGAGDSGPQLPVQCALKANSTTLVDDLSTHPDAGQQGLQFNSQIFTVPSNIGDGFYVVAQPGGQQQDFTFYAVDLTHRNAASTSVLGADAGLTNVRLVDVNPTFSPPTAMFETAAPGNNMPLDLSTVPLPASWNGSVGSPSSLATSVAIGGNANGGRLTGSPAAMDYLFSVQAQGGNTNTTYVGKSGTAMTFTLLTSSNGNGSNTPFFDLGGQFFEVAGNLGDGGASQSTILAMNDNGGTPVQAPVPGPAGSLFDGILGAQVSAVDSTKAAVFGVSIDTSGNATPWTGLFPPSKLTTLAIGPQQFKAGQPIMLSEIPFNAGGTFWGPGDQVFIVGTPQSGANQILLIWWSADGRAIAHPATSGPIITRPNQILEISIGISNTVADVAASVFISWVEEVAPDGGGSVYDQLWAAEATCFVVSGG